jgi:signal transduction histidine kinase/DNA-binding response OmpR family regulator
MRNNNAAVVSKVSLLKRAPLYLILSFILLTTIQLSCQRQHQEPVFTQLERRHADSIVFTNHTIDSLEQVLSWFIAEENKVGVVVAQRELSRLYRRDARFEKAIEVGIDGLQTAKELEDTLEIIQALNNIGTGFRRIAALDEAASYHYDALEYSELFSDKKSRKAIANRNAALNGIGNIQSTLGNTEAAEKAFREALDGERALNNPRGQAINYANIGRLFETREMIDSAWVYYRESMKFDVEANSELGIALCHNNFGRLYEKGEEWEKALVEYQVAYDIMKNSADKWHWLESCLGIARVNAKMGYGHNARKYLTEARITAQSVKSWERLAEAYELSYLLSKSKGDHQGALMNYQLHRAYRDSVINEQNYNSLQNIVVRYEQKKREYELAAANEHYEHERREARKILHYGIGVITLSLAALLLLLYALRERTRGRDILRKTEKMRTSFFTNITHEFRTPLTVILGFGRQLETGELKKAKEIEKAGEAIRRQGSSLLQLINQLLDISRIQSSIGRSEWCTGNIIVFLRMVVETFEAQANVRHIDLRFVAHETKVTMDFVPDYMKKIMHNLLSNALKYTPEGGRICISTRQERDIITIHVADTGSGIPPGDLPHVFKPFYRGENSQMEISSGVGLSLVYQIVKAMNGSITVKSSVNKGSIFTLTLPLYHGAGKWPMWPLNEITTQHEQWHVHSDPAELPKSPKMSAEKGTILIVEDDPDVLFYIGSLFEGKYNLLFSKDGADAFNKAESFIPDLIVTDLMMPGIDGYELCRRVRASGLTSHIPIIVVTAKCTEEDRIKGIEAGADAFLKKPFNAQVLNTLTEKLLEMRRSLKEKYGQILNVEGETEPDLPAADKNFFIKLTHVIYAQMTKGEIDLDDIASKMSMSRSQLNRKTQATIGLSASKYVLRVRMGKAQRLLDSDASTPVGEIALECGFADMGYFSRTFKQLFSMTPSQYRKRVR